ncbi:MAG TPA: DUF1127 domain-containing protein [Candidatus Competibacteraceae bacterium]|nr:DUF1127 domain-containing protein [Candidatus Competibacteraceae bacterium]
MHTIRFFEGVNQVLGQAERNERSWFFAPLHSLRGVLNTLAVWHERAVSRRQLLELDERMLADIGIDRATAMYIAHKPFWRA